MTPNADFRVEFGVLGWLYRALWCLGPHVVSGLATSILYMNESGIKNFHPYGVYVNERE